jgi:hypothetical protein
MICKWRLLAFTAKTRAKSFHSEVCSILHPHLRPDLILNKVPIVPFDFPEIFWLLAVSVSFLKFLRKLNKIREGVSFMILSKRLQEMRARLSPKLFCEIV